MRPRLSWLAAAMVAFAALPASAQTTTWTGGASNVTWGTPGNWSNGVPTSSGTAVFSGSTSTQPTNTSALTTGSAPYLIQFNSGAGAYTLGSTSSPGNFFFADGGGITVNAGVTTNQKIWTWIRSSNTSGTSTVAITNNGTGLLDLNVFNSFFASGTNTLGILSVDGSGTTQFASVQQRTSTNVTSVVKNGSGTLIILTSPTTAPDATNGGYFSGSTTINGGVLQLGDSTALGSGTGSIVFGGGTLRYSGSNTVDYSSRIRSGTSAISIDTAGQSVTFSSALAASNTGGLTKLGSGTLTLSGGGANTYTGTTTVSAGALTLNKTAGVTAVPGNLVISDAVLTFGTSSQIADTSAVTMSGSNAAFNSPGGYNSAAPSVTALDETIGSLTVTGGVFFPGGAGSTTGFVVTGSASFTGGSGNTSYLQSSGGLSSYGSLALVGMTDTTQTGTTFVPNRFALAGNNISRQTTLTVGSGGLSLDGSNLLLQIGSTAGALGSRLVLNGDVTTTGNAASSIRAPASETSTIGTRAVALSGTSGSVTRTFTIGGGGADLTVSIPITNGSATTAGITKAGVGTLTLGTANTYTGTTTISAGTLALGSAGSFANSTRITVGDTGSSGAVLDLTAKTGTFAFTSSQTVGGIGTINIGAGKTVSSAGIWAPGNSIGSNAVTGNLTLTGTSQFELGTPGTSTSAPGSSDFTAVSGTLTLGGALTLLDNAGANGLGSAAGGVYRLFTYGSAVSGSYASVTANPTATTRTSLSNISYGGSGTGAGQGVFLSVYNLAAGSLTSGTTVNFGTVLKGTSLSQALSITNTAPGGSFTEGLDAAFGALSGGATTNSGSISLLAGGSTSTAMTVGLGSATAGAKSGSAVVNYTSDGAGTSGLGEVGAGSQTVNLLATVLDPAVASFGSGPTALTTFTLNFGSVNQGDTVSAQNFSLFNLLQTAGYTADLALVDIISGTGNTSAITTDLATFNSLASGTFNSWQGFVNTTNQGTFSNSWTLQFKSANGGTAYAGDTTQTLTLSANVIVVPEPGAIALAGIGIAAAAYALRRRK